MANIKNRSIISNNQVEKDYTKSISLDHRKKFAQFFTPFQLASLMADWLIQNDDVQTILEPAFGLGVFSRALLNKKKDLLIKGYEIDEIIFTHAKDNFNDKDKVDLHLKDYMFNDWSNKYDGIICNPPYFKFHDYNNKTILTEIENHTKIKLNGFTNLYALFLLKSIYQLNPNGRLAYIIPSEFLNSDYGKLVKAALIKYKVLRHVVVFDFEENVFDDALTTSCILFCANDKHSQKVMFSSLKKIDELDLIKKYIYNYPNSNVGDSTVKLADLEPDVKWRKYYQKQNGIRYNNLIPFSSIAKVVRGIATGANEYFTFSKSKANQYGINKKYLLPCICKAVDVKSNFFTTDNFHTLINSNKQAYLLNAINSNDENIIKYVELGEELGIHKKYLTSCRNPWFSLENRPPSPIWVSVFNRSGLKFIRNEANISNLTTFHCVYPVQNSLFNNVKIDILFAYLLTDVAREIFEDNRREYGNGLQKFEPNDLNKAMMLDLSLLKKNTEKKVLYLYDKYRSSVINNSPDCSFLNEINTIFKSEFCNAKYYSKETS
jgi:adenine-specific DNA-methyltransferase